MKINAKWFKRDSYIKFLQTKALAIFFGIAMWGIVSLPFSFVTNDLNWLEMFFVGIIFASFVGSMVAVVAFVLWAAQFISNVWHGEEKPWRVDWWLNK